MATPIHRGKEVLSEGGFRHLLLMLLKKTLSPVFELGSIRIFCREVDRDLAPAALDNIVLRLGTISDLPGLLEAYDSSREEAVLKARFLHGDWCFLAADHSGRILSCRWCAISGSRIIPELGMSIVLDSEEAYAFDSYTRSDSRGQGLDAVCRNLTIRTLAAAGIKRYYFYVRGDQPKRLRACSKYAKVLGGLIYIRFIHCRPVIIVRTGSHLPILSKFTHYSGRKQPLGA